MKEHINIDYNVFKWILLLFKKRLLCQYDAYFTISPLPHHRVQYRVHQFLSKANERIHCNKKSILMVLTFNSRNSELDE